MHAFLSLIARFGKPYRRNFTLGPASKVLEVVFDLLIPLVIAWMIDAGVLANNMQVVLTGGGVLAGMATLGFSVTLICQKMASVASQGIGTDIRQALVASANASTLGAFNSIGHTSFVTRTTNDVNQVQTGIAMLIRQVIRWPILALGSVICALAISVPLGLILCCSLPLCALVFWLVMRKTSKLFLAIQAKLDQLGIYAKETITGTKTIRAYNQTHAMTMRFTQTSAEQSTDSIYAAMANACLSPATYLFMNSCALLVVFSARSYIGAGTLQIGQVMALLGYMNQLLLAIGYVANLVVIFNKAFTSSVRIEEALMLPKRRVGFVTSLDTTCTPLLAVDKASVKSTSGAYILQDLTFSGEAGHVVGVIGGTGSGKTTLIHALCNNISLSNGEIELYKTPLATIAPQTCASHIAVVPQHTVLFKGTIRTNLTWRNNNATDEELFLALKDACCDFVESLDAEVEEGGANFSGGQRQRLAIARALVGKSSVLLLDDATSALDYVTEARILKRIAQTHKDSVVVLVSQRVQTVSQADAIICLDHGRMVGYGSHQDLLKTCSVYKSFYDSQREAESAEYV